MNFPLGIPKNRPASETQNEWPIEGRPNWFRDRNGREYYREPNPRPQPQAGNNEKKPK